MPKRKILGISFPVLIAVFALIVILLIFGFLGGSLGQSMVGNIGLPEWLTVPKPEVELEAGVIFSIFGWPISNGVIASWISIAVLVLFAWLATRRMKLVPTGAQRVLEFIMGSLLDFCKSVAGEKWGRRFFPLVCTIFLFVITNGLLSKIPGFETLYITLPNGHTTLLLRDANTDINLPLALALVSFVAVEYYGFRALGGRHYLREFVNVTQLSQGIRQLFRGKIRPALGGIFMGIIELFVSLLEDLSKVTRVVSFTFRLFGNMLAGAILLLIISFLASWVVTVPFYVLELLVSFIQALVFGGLTLVFLTMAVSGHRVEEEKSEYTGKKIHVVSKEENNGSSIS
jgi:F-type H+-transporting ATPase subunit a